MSKVRLCDICNQKIDVGNTRYNIERVGEAGIGLRIDMCNNCFESMCKWIKTNRDKKEEDIQNE